jgi:hypothetical protein
MVANAAATITRKGFISFFILRTRRQHRRCAKELDFLVERVSQLLAQQHAGGIFRESRFALLDGRVDDLEILVDDRDSRGVELSLPPAHDILEHLDLFPVY